MEPKRGFASARALLVAATVLACSTTARAEGKQPDPKALVQKVVQVAGGVNALRDLQDVEYTYIYRDGKSGKMDVSVERYVFHGEKSWAHYPVHERTVHPDTRQVVTQGFNGDQSWELVGNKRTTDPQARKRADFLRKTNFYWFCMTFKLLDPGLMYSYEGTQQVGDINYELVKVQFKDGVGDASDTYVLYINPKTWRVDQFLFTVMDFGKADPSLMKVQYERVSGILLPTLRSYAPADWKGNPKGAWTDEISLSIHFNNDFPASMFDPPPRP